MMTYYVETPVMGVSVLSDRVGKPFSVRPAADDDLLGLFFFMTFWLVTCARKPKVPGLSPAASYLQR